MTMQTVNSKTILEFKNYLLMEEKAAATVEKYIRDVSVFAEYLDGRELTKEMAIAYKQQLSENGYAIRSVNSVIASLNGLFQFLGRHDCKLKAVKLQRQIFCPEEKELTRAEYNRLLAAAQKKGNERLNLLIQTICGTGIRVSELKYITVQAVRDGKAVVNCKNKTRVIFIPVSIQKLLKEYIRSQGIEAGSVFVSKSGKPLNRSNIWRDMKALCKSAGVSPDKVFPHNLRHLFARTFYSIERDIVRLADLLGHSNVNTTRIYTMETGNQHYIRLEKVQKKLMT